MSGGSGNERQQSTHHLGLAICWAVSTVPPRTTGLLLSTIDEPSLLPTRGWTSDLMMFMGGENCRKCEVQCHKCWRGHGEQRGMNGGRDKRGQVGEAWA